LARKMPLSGVWNRSVRRSLNQRLRVAVSNGEYDVYLIEPKKTQGWLTW